MTTKTSNMEMIQNVNFNKSVKQSVKRLALTSMMALALMLVTATPAAAQVRLGFKGGLQCLPV